MHALLTVRREPVADGTNRPIVEGSPRLHDGTILAILQSGSDEIGRRLTQLGYRTVVSGAARDSLDLLAAGGFDLVVIDMTAGDFGLKLLRELRASRDLADMPVIALTERTDAVGALAAGADDQVARPFALDLLAARIAHVLARAGALAELKRANAALDARIATRAIALGEANRALAATRADRERLIASVQALSAQLAELSETSAAR